MNQFLLRNQPGSSSCDIFRLLARKITKGIHSCKPTSLNCPVGGINMTPAADLSLQSSGEFRRAVVHVEPFVNKHALRTVADQAKTGLVRKHQGSQTLHNTTRKS